MQGQCKQCRIWQILGSLSRNHTWHVARFFLSPCPYLCPCLWRWQFSGVAKANQTKERSVHELFTGQFRNNSSMLIMLVFKEKIRIHKNGRNSWTSWFGPFFGLVCRGDSWRLGGILGDNSGEGTCESKIVSRQSGDNFSCETSRCLAGPSGQWLVFGCCFAPPSAGSIHHVMCSKNALKGPKIITSHDALEPLKRSETAACS